MSGINILSLNKTAKKRQGVSVLLCVGVFVTCILGYFGYFRHL